MQTEAEIYNRTNQIIAEGAKIIDVGACSTRPGSKFVDEAEEKTPTCYGTSYNS